MLHILRKIQSVLLRLLEGAVVLLMAALVLDVLWQVATRYVWNRPSSWTDELATLLIIWLALLGASVAFARRAHLGIDLIVARLPARKRVVAELFAYLCIAFFGGAILVYGGLQLVSLTLLTGQTSPALGMKIGHVYFALPISGAFVLLFSLEGILERLVQLRRPSPHQP